MVHEPVVGGGSIGRITPDGVVSNFTDPGINTPLGITAGVDGNVWFTNYGSSTIGRITPAGTVTIFGGYAIDLPVAITNGPDGNLWFTNEGDNSIGRISPDGMGMSHFLSPLIQNPTSITAGADGNLWFTNDLSPTQGSIGRLTPAGFVSTFFDPYTAGPGPLPPRPTARCTSPNPAISTRVWATST